MVVRECQIKVNDLSRAGVVVDLKTEFSGEAREGVEGGVLGGGGGGRGGLGG